MNENLLRYFEKIAVVQHNQHLFRILCGLELEIRKIDGTPLNSLPEKKTFSAKNRISAAFHCLCDESIASCISINNQIIETAIDTKQEQTYICAGGYQKLLIPIVVKEEPIGFLFTGENNHFRFASDQKKTILNILKDFVAYIIEKEFSQVSLDLYSDGTMTRQKELLDRAVRYIHKNFHSNEMTLKDVSENNGISYHYLSRIFKKELKTTFAQFRNQVRLDAAAKMLKNHRLSVSQISYACGFEDPAYFCKVFKTNFGVSPLNYRNQKELKTVIAN